MFFETKNSSSSSPKHQKDVSKGKGIAGSGIDTPTSPEGNNNKAAEVAKEKAQNRRAQVRRAQIQHRQRKANYIKQLELDIVSIREMITDTERESNNLRSENAAIRQNITFFSSRKPQSEAVVSPTGTGFVSMPSTAPSVGGSPVFSLEMLPPSATTSLFADPGLEDITVALQIDEAMNYPCLKMTRNSSPTASGCASSLAGVSSPRQATTGIPGIDLTPEQTDQAINFILALEHVCWGHFHASGFATDNPEGRVSNHTMMASSIALSPAPPAVFKQLGKTQLNVWFTPSAFNTNPISNGGDVSWQSRGLTLQSLHGLATSLNPGDLELTPVQAWFELAQAFDIDLLLSPTVIDNLKREFHGVVKCIHYGALIERQAFESVVCRVISTALGIDENDIAALSGRSGGTAATGGQHEEGSVGRPGDGNLGPFGGRHGKIMLADMPIAGPSG